MTDERIYPGAYAPLELAPVYEFENTWANRNGAKEAAIRSTFGVAPTRYYMALLQIISTPEALAADPMLTNRLRRLAEGKAQTRAQRRYDRQEP